MSDTGCSICEAAKEGTDPAQAFVRGFNLGRAHATASPEIQAESMRMFCLRHCHVVQMHEQWSERNAGKDPPWEEPEPKA